MAEHEIKQLRVDIQEMVEAGASDAEISDQLLPSVLGLLRVIRLLLEEIDELVEGEP